MSKEIPLGKTPAMVKSKASNRNPIIIEPGIGVDNSCYYVVEVAFTKSNPVHRAIMFSGFWHGGGGYIELWTGTYEKPYDLGNAIYLNILFKIDCIGGDPEEERERIKEWRAT